MQVLLETVYTCLTNRKIDNVRPKNDDDLIPPFARSTAVQVQPAAAGCKQLPCECPRVCLCAFFSENEFLRYCGRS